ncbi:NPFG-protein-coupled receptor [Daphnia sinensis]|uniref:NPFG-protein-coupled receptor n=1 Tax=Daphnia sinensis TaxID=1820382 RepID=A0AAD5L5I9_9CRUS|nr:NPFG-protein-coupled receptor [Daphnia sinensis]
MNELTWTSGSMTTIDLSNDLSLSESFLNNSTETNVSNTNSSLLAIPAFGDVELDLSLIERFRSNSRVNDVAFFCLIAAYCVLIIFGTIGNSLVVYVVARQPAMRTARNVFVVNLAISDLLLCLITMPLTLMEIRSYTWPLGNSPVSCKMVGSLQAVSIFVSTLSITAIALDRYQLIVYPTKKSFQLTGALLALAGIWTLGVVLALPLFIVRTLQHHDIPIPNSPITSVDYCLEEWPNERGRSLYSIGSILIQYALPIITVSVAHARICNKLQVRMASMSHQQQQSTRQPPSVTNGQQTPNDSSARAVAREEKLRKTNTLLVAIAIIFTICWLPMNTFNVVVDTWNVFGDDTETMLIVYAVCHMVGMSSACANPLLYGWLNDNFRKEFHKIGTSFIAKAMKTKANTTSNANRPELPSVHVASKRLEATSGVAEKDGQKQSIVTQCPQATGATTAVTMLPSPTGVSHYRTEVTVVTHLVAEPPASVHRVNEINAAVSQEQHL